MELSRIIELIGIALAASILGIGLGIVMAEIALYINRKK
jgi:hypothetical protein